MFRQILVTGLMTAIMAGANGYVLAAANDPEKDRERALAAEKQDWRAAAERTESPVFDRASRKSTMKEYNQTKSANKGFSTTTKVLIGVGIAAAVLAVVFVAARDDLRDDILR